MQFPVGGIDAALAPGGALADYCTVESCRFTCQQQEYAAACCYDVFRPVGAAAAAAEAQGRRLPTVVMIRFHTEEGATAAQLCRRFGATVYVGGVG